MADRFWVNGSGNWSDAATHWAATSGGAPGAGNLPGSSDRAIFDAASNTTGYTVTIDVNNTTVGDVLFSAPPSVSGTVTLAGSVAWLVNGNFTLLAGMGFTHNGRITFIAATGTKVITSNGVTITSAISFQSGAPSTAIFQLGDNMSLSITNTSTLALSTGSFDPNGKKVSLTANGSQGVAGAFTFFDLERIGGPSKLCTLQFSAAVSVTHTLTITGNSAVNRVIVQSDIVGTPRTITAAAVVITNSDFQDITGAGAAAPFTGTSLGDCLGNSGITFTPSATQTATGTASFTWSTHGWTSRVPLPQDDVIIPNAFIASRVITADMPRLGRSITFSCTGSPAFTPTSQVVAFGSFAFASGMSTTTGFALVLQARSAVTFQSSGVAMSLGLSFATPGISVTLLDSLSTASGLVFRGGTFNDGGFSVTAASFDMQLNNTKTLNKSGSWIITGSGAVWTIVATGTTINATGSTKFTDATASTKTFAGGGFTYNNLWLSGGGTGVFQVTGANSFNQFKIDSGLSVQFTAATTTTAADWQLSGATIGSITAAGHTLAMSGAGKVQAVGATISRSTATPANTFYAVNSANGGNNSGWIFGAYLALDTMAPVLAACPGWSVRKSWRLAIDTLPVLAAFADWQPRDVRPDPDYVIAASPRTRSISR